ncbi:hypothetical protein BC829DRAFT_386911 [Chytridium lagenaria]|nr:hypothetical protein BC829DRAFT_386911 [Chytridium lagenaria]
MRPSVPEKLDALIDCLSAVNREKKESGGGLIQPAFCTWRGIMTKIFCTPYSNRDAWELRATFYKVNDVLGYRFESLSTIAKPPCDLIGPNDEELVERKERGIVNTNIQFCSVFKTKLGDNEIVMGAEVDCMETDKAPTSNRQKYYAQLLKMYFQSWLAGIPKVIVGYRDDNGWLKSIETLKTMEMPRMVRGKDHGWDPIICINFANAFLHRLSRTLKRYYADGEGDRNAVHTIRFDPGVNAIEIFGANHDGVEVFVPEL